MKLYGVTILNIPYYCQHSSSRGWSWERTPSVFVFLCSLCSNCYTKFMWDNVGQRTSRKHSIENLCGRRPVLEVMEIFSRFWSTSVLRSGSPSYICKSWKKLTQFIHVTARSLVWGTDCWHHPYQEDYSCICSQFFQAFWVLLSSRLRRLLSGSLSHFNAFQFSAQLGD